MSDEPISAPEPVDPVLLERAGWSNAELIWEQIQETAAECLAAGMDGYVSKPIDQDLLSQEIMRCVTAALSTQLNTKQA